MKGNRGTSPQSWLSGLLLFLRVALVSAPKDSICAQLARSAPLSSGQHWACRFPVLYALWRELRSLPRRILYQHEKGLFFSGLAPEKIAPECRLRDRQYQARIRGIEKLRRLQNWVTLGDESLYLEGLADGWELHTRMDKPEHEFPFSCSLSQGGNSMPPSATQQYSKHDL